MHACKGLILFCDINSEYRPHQEMIIIRQHSPMQSIKIGDRISEYHAHKEKTNIGGISYPIQAKESSHNLLYFTVDMFNIRYAKDRYSTHRI